jgi:hypothetical protein
MNNQILIILGVLELLALFMLYIGAHILAVVIVQIPSALMLGAYAIEQLYNLKHSKSNNYER